MEEVKIVSFIKRLSSDTVNDKINWKRLDTYHNRTSDTPKTLSNLLWEDEFRHIDYHNSYVATLAPGPGDVFLIYEDDDPGRTETPHTTGYKIYLYDDSEKEASYLSCPAYAVYQLLNAIQSYIAKSESSAEKFIDDYLSLE